MIQKHKKLIVFTLIFSFLLLGTGVFINKNSEVQASDGEMLTMLRGMNQVLGLIAERLTPFNVNNGNVGIGVTNPQETLHVGGHIAMTNTNDKKTRILRFDHYDDITLWNEGSGRILFGTRDIGGDNIRVRINNDGSVGVGASPSSAEKFSVGLNEGKGVRIGNWGNNGSTAFFVTPATKDQSVATIRGIEGQESNILSVQRTEENREVYDILTVRPDGRVCLENICITRDDLEKLKSL